MKTTVILLAGLTAGLVASGIVFWALLTDDTRATVWTLAGALWVVAVAVCFVYVAGYIGRLLPPWRHR